jgi:hypothetical protein
MGLGQAMTHGIRTRDTRTAQIPRLGAVGGNGLSADSPLHNQLTSFDVAAPHCFTMSVLGGLGAEGHRAARGSLLYIYERRG